MNTPARANTPSAEVIREFNDRGTLWLLEDPVHLQNLVQILDSDLAARLDVDHAERVNRSFIPADLQKAESDLIFRIPYISGNDNAGPEVLIYVLLEHQSKPDPLMGLRLFTYMGQLWDTQLREWRDARATPPLLLLPVVPVVLYTGQENWNTPISLSSVINVPSGLEHFVPTWDTLFLNLHRIPLETLSQCATAVGYALEVLRAEKEPLEELERVVAEAMVGLEGLTEEQSGQWLRVAWYLVLLAYHRRERPEYDELMALIQKQARESKFRERMEVENMVQSMAQYVEEKARKEGQVEGRVEGRVEGKVEQTRTLVLRLANKRFGTPDDQAHLALEAIGSLEVLERMADRLLEVESWQELLHG